MSQECSINCSCLKQAQGVSAAAQGADMTLFSQHVSGFIAMNLLHNGRSVDFEKPCLPVCPHANTTLTQSRQGMHGRTGGANLKQVTLDESQELNNIWQIY
jgi:hypothetical protein